MGEIIPGRVYSFRNAYIRFIFICRPGTDRASAYQLVKNARETCERRTDKNIEIKFFSKGNPTFTISDNGEGILPDVLDKIFVPFFTTKTSSSGIGLSLCKQIMTLHDGSINVKSEIGKGSCFILTFPK